MGCCHSSPATEPAPAAAATQNGSSSNSAAASYGSILPPASAAPASAAIAVSAAPATKSQQLKPSAAAASSPAPKGAQPSSSRAKSLVPERGEFDEEFESTWWFNAASAANPHLTIKLEAVPEAGSTKPGAVAAAARPSRSGSASPLLPATGAKAGSIKDVKSGAASKSEAEEDDDSAREDSTVRMQDLGLNDDLDLR